MSILHGSFLVKKEEKYFFIWGETWRNIEKHKYDLEAEFLYIYPFLIEDKEEILRLLKKCGIDRNIGCGEIESLDSIWHWEMALFPVQKKPKSKTVVPLLYEQFLAISNKLSSVILYPWDVGGLKIEPVTMLGILQKLPLNKTDYIASDLRFWSHVYRWGWDLICRQKFIPTIDEKNNCYWRPVLDSNIDQSRLEHFIQSMPSICRCYVENEDDPSIPQQELILEFLCTVIDIQIRQLLPAIPNKTDSMVSSWIEALSNPLHRKCNLSPLNNKRLRMAFNHWVLPIQEDIITSEHQLRKRQYRLCLKLQPPSSTQGDNYDNWRLDYFLQAIDNPDFLIPTEQIWIHPHPQLEIGDRLIENPQEIILKGLGLAAKFFEPIRDSLEEATPNYCRINAISAYQFVRSVAWQLQDNGLGVILPKGLSRGADEKRLGVKIQAEVNLKKGERLTLNTLINYNLKVVVGNRVLTQKEFHNLLAKKSPLVEVDGQWLALQPADVKAAEEIFNNSKTPVNLTVEDAIRLSSGSTETIAKLPVVGFESSGALAELLNSINDNSKIEILETPKNFNGTLRPYQKVGFSWLYFLQKWGLGGCLADDMGLGKTVQLIALILTIKEREELTKPCLIVCPTSVLNNWEKELEKFAPSLKVLLHHGENRSKDNEFIEAVKNVDVVVTSYPLVYRDLDILNQIEWQGVVLDEAQNIKNPQAKQTQAVRQLKSDFRIALTGTPIENRLSELWSILDFLNPGYLGPQQFFQRRFTLPIEKYGDEHSLKTLKSLVKPFILRRLKTDKNIIQDLPEKQEMNVYCGLSAEQAELYQNLVEKSLQEIEESTGIKRHGLILSLLVKLKQICNHPAHFLKEEKIDTSSRSGKLLRLEEMLEEVVAEGDRSLIFTQFAEWGSLLQPYLSEKLGVEVLFLSGNTKTEKRQEMIDRFQNDPQGPPIFILSLKAGGTGLNLTRANHVFHYDRWWNPAVENQATDRAYRIGQKQNVQVHKFICTGTLEEKIDKILEGKKQLAEQTIETGEEWLTNLDTNQLRELLVLERNAVL
ncbi:MAG: DEAD/DEAH box helicase [Geminocystis sp.]|nr:DEAD/DEAH box helicase [Geminocystis sp.]HIK38439.1 DEAD/DEAH box helicase [Geminocystis sp. M7585_C2015_104]MCS7147784.1 DEAD/DEAH box helicase [Geminocystis sp.]MCX8079196.1 DEAD/DEAH box helicase [Geminocystis sp.]MDW8116642.1 DEAD/DEAH box helicase [Geminocystis sp.]